MNDVLIKQLKINFAFGNIAQHYNKRSAGFQWPTGLSTPLLHAPLSYCVSGILLQLTINLVYKLSIPVCK